MSDEYAVIRTDMAPSDWWDRHRRKKEDADHKAK
jgi:hypothetical protein